MTLHDYITEYQIETGCNISKEVFVSFKAIDSTLKSFVQLGYADRKKGIARRDEDEFIQWGEDIIPGSSMRDAEIASFIGELAFEKYSEGYDNEIASCTRKATPKTHALTCACCTDIGNCPEYTPGGICVSDCRVVKV